MKLTIEIDARDAADIIGLGAALEPLHHGAHAALGRFAETVSIATARAAVVEINDNDRPICDFGIVGCVLSMHQHTYDAHRNARHSQIEPDGDHFAYPVLSAEAQAFADDARYDREFHAALADGEDDGA